jgi:hypothetical protein
MPEHENYELILGRLARTRSSKLLSFILSVPRWPSLPYTECQGLKSDVSKFQSWNFGTKPDKSEIVRKLEQIQIYSDDFEKKRVIFVTLVRVTEFGVLRAFF